LLGLCAGCDKGDNSPPTPPVTPASFSFSSFSLNGQAGGYAYRHVNTTPVLKVSFSAPVNRSTVNANVSFINAAGSNVTVNTTYENNDSAIVVQPASPLNYLQKYSFKVNTGLKSVAGSG